jgi:hypothetical protein
MCHATKCRNCGKTTWSGCGSHIESVKRRVPPEQWCDGHPDQQPRSTFGSFFRRK